MAVLQYIFTASNGQLVVELDNGANDWENNEKTSYRQASVQRLGNHINISDSGIFQKDFLFEHIKTIGGVAPTDINDAFTKILALIPSV